MGFFPLRRPDLEWRGRIFWGGAPIFVMDYVRSRKRKGSSSELDVARSIELLILEASLLGVSTAASCWSSLGPPSAPPCAALPEAEVDILGRTGDDVDCATEEQSWTVANRGKTSRTPPSR